MIEYAKEYDNWPQLSRKISTETLALFVIAEKYLNGAIFQLTRANEALLGGMNELAFLEVHSYLAFISAVYKCFKAIGECNREDETLITFIDKLDDSEYFQNLLAAKYARNFIEHIGETIVDIAQKRQPIDSDSEFVSKTVPSTVMIDDRFVYFVRERQDGKQVRLIRFIPIGQTLYNLKVAYERIFEILNSRDEDLRPRADSSGCNFIIDAIAQDCNGTVEEIIDGIVGSSSSSVWVRHMEIGSDYHRHV